MSKKTRHSPEDKDLSPEALKRRADRRAKRERDIEAEQREIKAARAKVLSSSLHEYGNCGLIAIRGYDKDIASKFREGYEAEVEVDKRLLLLDADGTIQGEDQGDEFAKAAIDMISKHSERLGRIGVVGFDEVDFSGDAGHGTPQVTDYVTQLLRASREKPRTGLAVVAFGTGTVSDLLASHDYDRSIDRGIISDLDVTLGLNPRGEPLAVLDLPHSYAPRKLSPS